MIDLIKLYDSGQVTRYHSNPQMNRRMQTNADHQWGVFAILYTMLNGEVNSDLMAHALLHDIGERRVGDMSSESKSERTAEFINELKSAEGAAIAGIIGKSLPKISHRDAVFLKAADRIEAILCIALYAPRPDDVSGVEKAIRAISDLCAEDDTGLVYALCAKFVQTVINRAFGAKSDFQIVPF